MARNVRHSNWIQIIQKRLRSFLSCGGSSYYISHFFWFQSNTSFWNSQKRKKNRLPREWVCVFSCTEFVFWETLNSKQRGYFFFFIKPNSFSSYILLLLKSDNVASGNQWEGRKLIFKWYKKKIDTSRHTHWIEKEKKKLLQRNDYFYFTQGHKKVDSNLPLLNKNVHSPW